MKYDDAKWHSGGKFPNGSPASYGGTHIALLLRWCFLKDWAGALHLAENSDDVEQVKRGELPATDFLFKCCDGKFTDEDLNADGNAFIESYYGPQGKYLGDYARTFQALAYVAEEQRHDFVLFSKMVQSRYDDFLGPARRPWWRPW